MIDIIRTRKTFDFTGEMRLAGDRELFNYKAEKIGLSDLYLFTFRRADDDGDDDEVEKRTKTVRLERITPEDVRRTFAFVSWDDLARTSELRFDAVDMGIEKGEDYEEAFGAYKTGKREGKIVDSYPSFGGAYNLISSKADSVVLNVFEDGRCTEQYALCFEPIAKRRAKRGAAAAKKKTTRTGTRTRTRTRTRKTTADAKKRAAK